MKNLNLLLIIFLFCGCQATAQHKALLEELDGIELAKVYLESGELYQAKKMTNAYLKDFPNDIEAQTLMASILSVEIARHKEAHLTSVPEDQSSEEQATEVTTWLERARTLLAYKQYNAALEAAENVFRYDPRNLEASSLIDQIYKNAMKEGKSGLLVRNDMIRDEVEMRVERYRTEALARVEMGRKGEARLLVRKLLLLSPEDPVGLDLHKQLQQVEIAV